MPLFSVRDEIQEIAYQVAGDRIEAAIYNPTKAARGKAVGALKAEVKEAILAKYPDAAAFEISSGVRVYPEEGVPRLHSRQAEARRRSRLL